MVVVVVPVTGLRLVAVRRLAPPPRSLLLRLGCAEERVVRVVRGAAVVREDARGMLSVKWLLWCRSLVLEADVNVTPRTLV